MHFCLTTYNLNSNPNHSIRSHIYCLNTLSYAILLYNECLQNKYLDDYYKMAIFPPLNAVGLFEKHESLFWLTDTFYHSPTNNSKPIVIFANLNDQLSRSSLSFESLCISLYDFIFIKIELSIINCCTYLPASLYLSYARQ